MPKKGTVSVVGLGYVGLPLAVLASEKGWQVTGYETVAKKVASINAGEPPFIDLQLASDLKKHPVAASTDPAVVASSDVVVIAVPTPVDEHKHPDLTPVRSALTSICPYLRAGQVLIVESTINPGVMDEVVLPLLAEAKLPLEKDSARQPLYVAHCPERVNPGDEKWNVRNIPRVLGGYSAKGTKLAAQFYESILEAPIKIMGSIQEAEAVKILENSFRDVNIAFINEMAKSFAVLGIDVVHVIEGAATKPFAFLAHYPGNGVGGHCISVDPYYMIERAREAGFDHEFLKLARNINDSMPEYTVELLEKGLKQVGKKLRGTTVALLGLAYKKDIGDLRESPALKIRELLEKKGAKLRVYDPFVPQQSTVPRLADAIDGATVLMIATNHSEFVNLLAPKTIQAAGITLVIDGRNCLDGDGIASQGIPYWGIGRARSPKK